MTTTTEKDPYGTVEQRRTEAEANHAQFQARHATEPGINAGAVRWGSLVKVEPTKAERAAIDRLASELQRVDEELAQVCPLAWNRQLKVLREAVAADPSPANLQQLRSAGDGAGLQRAHREQRRGLKAARLRLQREFAETTGVQLVRRACEQAKGVVQEIESTEARQALLLSIPHVPSRSLQTARAALERLSSAVERGLGDIELCREILPPLVE